MKRDWKEVWIDKMGLIVALSGEQRFAKIEDFKASLALLSADDQAAVKQAMRQRFTPSNGQDGCSEATASITEATT